MRSRNCPLARIFDPPEQITPREQSEDHASLPLAGTLVQKLPGLMSILRRPAVVLRRHFW